MGKINKIAVMTSGGDSPGMNAAIRSVVRTCAFYDKECIGVYRGYQGMIEGDFTTLTARNINNIINKGGTILKSARSDEFRTSDGRKKAFQQLKDNRVQVVYGVLENDCKALNKHFFTFNNKKRPYITLKWAQSKNGKIAGKSNERIFISNDITNRLVHKWRAQEAAIMVGTNTALNDNPLLTARLWQGKNPIRILLDKELNVPLKHHLFNTDAITIVFNTKKNGEENNIKYYRLTDFNLRTALNALHILQVQSILVEGGSKLLQSFIDDNLWDEIRIIENKELIMDDGLQAPILKNAHLAKKENYLTDSIYYYHPV